MSNRLWESMTITRYLMLTAFNLVAFAFAYWVITDLRWEWIGWLLLWLPWMLVCNLVLRKTF
jgi:hypothetical protein